jgi:uncharacterized protein RhaS with RHS repeats
MQQRYYDPLCGCFLSTDPVTALKGPFNRYWYANNNPYRFTDPDGRLCATTDGKESCTFDKFKDKKGGAISREQALSSGKRVASRILRAEAGMTAKYAAAKNLAAHGGSITIKGSEAAGIPDQAVSGTDLVHQMETVTTIATGEVAKDPGTMASTEPGIGWTASNSPITFYKYGSVSPDPARTFGHEILHTIYSGVGLSNGGWANPFFRFSHQAPFEEASDAIK